MLNHLMCMVLIYIFVSEQFILLIILITDIDNQIEDSGFGLMMTHLHRYIWGFELYSIFLKGMVFHS